jgi:hypothetical protein
LSCPFPDTADPELVDISRRLLNLNPLERLAVSGKLAL